MSIGFSPRRAAIGLVLAASSVIGWAGCTAASNAVVEAPASLTTTPQFQATWWPLRTYDKVPAAAQTLRWQEPKGTAGHAPRVEALQLESRHPSTTINLLVVSAAAYPPGYWQSFVSSTTWHKFTEAGRTVVVDPASSGSSTTAMSEDRGYVIQLTTTGLSEQDLLRVMLGVRWR